MRQVVLNYLHSNHSIIIIHGKLVRPSTWHAGTHSPASPASHEVEDYVVLVQFALNGKPRHQTRRISKGFDHPASCLPRPQRTIRRTIMLIACFTVWWGEKSLVSWAYLNLKAKRWDGCYLLTVGQERDMCLLNPFTDAEIELPHRNTFPNDDWVLNRYGYEFFVMDIVLTSRPLQTSDFMVLNQEHMVLGFLEARGQNLDQVKAASVQVLSRGKLLVQRHAILQRLIVCT